MKLYFAPEPGNTQAQVVLRCQSHLEDLGIKFVENVNAADLLLVQNTCSTAESLVNLGLPTVILERIDGCQLTANVRKWIQLPHVRGVLKNCTFVENDLHNTSPTWRYHETIIRRNRGMEIPERKVTPISRENLSKIRLGFTYAAYDKLQHFTEDFNIRQKRTIDLFFAGTVDYRDQLISWHRRQCVSAIRSLPKKFKTLVVEGRGLNARDYRHAMRTAKIVVSPWGWGELCYRDYEAMLSGCLNLKPEISHVADPANVWGSCYSTDFSAKNFVDRVRLILDNPLGNSIRADTLQRNYSTAWHESRTETAANRLYWNLRECLAGA